MTMNDLDKASPEFPAWLEVRVRKLADELSHHCGPIFVVPSLDSHREEIFGSGTYALIDTGEKRLLVTCYHVWDEYEKLHDAESKTRLAVAVSDSVISFKEPRTHLIAGDRDLDLAVFEFEPKTIGVLHQKSWFKVRDWPISKVNRAAYIVTVGYPGRLRKNVGGVCTVRSVPIPLAVTDTTDRTIAAFSTENNQQVLNDIKDSLAGISGSPAYCYSSDGERRLIGFAKVGPLERNDPDRKFESVPDSCLPAMFFTHASFLQRDGTLGRNGS